MFISKVSFIGFFFIIQASAFASKLTGLELTPASNTSIQEAIVEIDENSILSWEAKISEESEVIVKILNTSDIQLTYGCHLHGNNMACHEEHHAQGENQYRKSPLATLDFMKLGNQAALNKFSKTMKRKGKDLSIMTSYKVWLHEEGHSDGHDAGSDVWTKINYKLNGLEKEIFILCHVHGSQTDFSCHYNTSGENEPNLDFEEDDHDHDHDH